MNRRHFLSLIGASPLAARSYFDIGASWRKHESGLVVPMAGGMITVTALSELGQQFTFSGDLFTLGLNPGDSIMLGYEYGGTSSLHQRCVIQRIDWKL